MNDSDLLEGFREEDRVSKRVSNTSQDKSD